MGQAIGITFWCVRILTGQALRDYVRAAGKELPRLIDEGQLTYCSSDLAVAEAVSNHDTQERALEELARLAVAHPGEQFRSVMITGGVP